MHCKQVKNKSGWVWECFSDGPRNPSTGKRRLIKRRGNTKGEAKKRVEKAISELKENRFTHDANVTFESLVAEWLKVYAATGVKRGSVRIREKESNLMKKYFNKAQVNQITHHLYQNMLIDLNNQGYARSTISGVNTCANMMFNYAIRNGLIKENPRTGAVIPKKSITVSELETNKIEDYYFENNELDVFLSVVLSSGLDLDEEMFFTLAFSGMRPGELLALKKEDLNFDGNTIRISKTLYNENNNMRKYRLETTKTNKVRVIDMNPKIMNMLKKLVRSNNKHKMKYRNMLDEYEDADFVFQRFNGYPFILKNVASRMKRIMKLANIKKRLTPHSFRHTHITMLTESGAELPTIMHRVGHIDPNTTLKVYTHVTNKMKLKSTNNLTLQHNNLLDKLTF